MIKFNKQIIFLMQSKHQLHNFSCPGKQTTSLVFVNVRFPHAADNNVYTIRARFINNACLILRFS